MKRKLTLLLALLCLLAAFTGCGGKKELVPQSFISEMLDGAEFTDSLAQVDEAVALLLYGVDAADCKSINVYCGTAATAEEIAVFEANDSAAAERILSAAQARVAHQIETYKSYGPAAAMALEDAVVAKTGNFVVVVVCSDSQGAKKLAEPYL